MTVATRLSPIEIATMRLMDITRLRLPNSAGPKMRAPRMRKINVNAAPKSVPIPRVRRAQEKFCGLMPQLFIKDELIRSAEQEVRKFFK